MKQHNRVKQTLYGRAAMITLRLLKLFHQFDMANALKQTEFVMRKRFSYNTEKRVESNDEEKIPLGSKKGKIKGGRGGLEPGPSKPFNAKFNKPKKKKKGGQKTHSPT